MTRRLSPEVKEQRKEARKQTAAESPTKKPEKVRAPKAEIIQSLAVEINFPVIMDLKQALAFDADGNLIIGVQFKAKVDQYEIFRLVNLLKQPHGTLYATIGSPQSAMDFKFDTKTEKVEVIRAAKPISQVADKTVDKSQEQITEPLFPESMAVKIHAVSFNHIPEEEKPYGVAIDYVSKDGSGEIHTVAGRGMNPTDAVLAGVSRFLPFELTEPFEVMAALEKLEPSAEGYKLIRAIEVGSFDEEPDKSKGGEKQPAKGK